MRRALLLAAPILTLALLTGCTDGAAESDPTTAPAQTSSDESTAPTEEVAEGTVDADGLDALQLTAAEVGQGWTSVDTAGAEDVDPSDLLPDGATFDPAVCGEQVQGLQQGAGAPQVQSTAAFSREDGTFLAVTLGSGDGYADVVFDALDTALAQCATYSMSIPDMVSADYDLTPLDAAPVGDRVKAVVIGTSIDGTPAGSTAMLLSEVDGVVVSVLTTGTTGADSMLMEATASLAVEKVKAGH